MDLIALVDLFKDLIPAIDMIHPDKIITPRSVEMDSKKLMKNVMTEIEIILMDVVLTE